MNYHLTNDGTTVDFSLGQGSRYFEFGIDHEGLREFLRLGIAALAEMDALLVQKQVVKADAVNPI